MSCAKILKALTLIQLTLFLAASCATLKPADIPPSETRPAEVKPEEGAPGVASVPTGKPEPSPERPIVPEQPIVPERPIVPDAPKKILGTALVDPETLSAFFMQQNPQADRTYVRELAELYVEEAGVEGVSHEVAFIQMCLETGFLRFGGLVTPDMNNFCGLGSIGPGTPGERFPSPRIGVRAHVQHLKGYATEEPPVRELVDPRYRWIRYGSAPAIADLAGRWARDPEYGSKLDALLRRLYSFAFIKT
jgi:hypothetical protein